MTIAPEMPPLQMDSDGVWRVGKTRVTLDTVVGEYEDGATADEIVQNYDTLHPADVHAVISYYLRHHSEVEIYLAQRLQQAEQVRQENESRFSAQAWRERLLARQQAGRAA